MKAALNWIGILLVALALGTSISLAILLAMLWWKGALADERILGLVVGLPIFASGEESASSYAARQFGKWLGEVTGLPVIFFDERYSSSEAERLLGDAKMTSKRRKARRDMLAAQILLSAYLENPSRAERPPERLEDK